MFANATRQYPTLTHLGSTLYTRPIVGRITIRRALANLEDAAALHAVERASLRDSPYTPQEMVPILQRPEHLAYLAFAEGRVVGFCSCFETPAKAGQRLEIDMLGVMPTLRRQGIATRLICHSLHEAARRGVVEARALVASDNVASQRVFVKAGLKACEGPAGAPLAQELLLYEIAGDAPQSFLPPGWRWHLVTEGRFLAGGRSPYPFDAQGPRRRVCWLEDASARRAAMAECLQVQTLAYRGLWIERIWSVSPAATSILARSVVEYAKAEGLDEVGYLCAQTADEEGVLPWLRQGYDSAGSYYVFRASSS